MVCHTTCVLAGAFIFSSFFMMATVDKRKITQDFMAVLDDKQKDIYKQIIAERFKIYSEGFILGFLKVLVLLALLSKTKYYKKFNLACLSIVIIFVTNVFYYILHKKSTYMIEHLKTKQQKIAWLNIYKKMQFSNYAGFLIGLIGMVLFSISFCK